MGRIGEELAVTICDSGWAKSAVSEVDLGSMNSHFCNAIKYIVAKSEVIMSPNKKVLLRSSFLLIHRKW